MSNQTRFNDNILDEVIPIYLDSVSAKERLENDILRLQGEVEDIKTANGKVSNEKDELDEKISEKLKEENKIQAIPRTLLGKTGIICFICFFLITLSLPISSKIFPTILDYILFGLLHIGGLLYISTILYLFFANPITSFYLKYSYKHNQKYRVLKDTLSKDIKKQSELQASIDNMNATIEDKESEIDNKRRELEKLNVAVKSMERKIGRKLILERAVMFGVPSEVLDIMQNIDDILEPNQESLEEGKGQFTLTTPTTI